MAARVGYNKKYSVSFSKYNSRNDQSNDSKSNDNDAVSINDISKTVLYDGKNSLRPNLIIMPSYNVKTLPEPWSKK